MGRGSLAPAFLHHTADISQPKGDLSVLLGDIPRYDPTALERTDDLPELPIENKHPYHIVVVAAQECPTPSGVPRGLGAGLRKGVIPKVEGLRGREPSVALRKEERDAVLREIREKGKERAKVRGESKERTTSDPKGKDATAARPSSPVTKDKLSNSTSSRERSVSAEEKAANDSKPDPKAANGSAHADKELETNTPKFSPPLNKDKELARELQAPFSTSLDRALDKAFDRVERLKDTIAGEHPTRTRTPVGDDVQSPDEDAAGVAKANGPKGWSSMLEGKSHTLHCLCR